MHLSKCFSVLLVSGHGQKCAKLRDILHRTLLVRDSKESKPRVLQHKFDKHNDPDGHRRLSKLLARKILPVMVGINKEFFGIDLQKSDNEKVKKPFVGPIHKLSDLFPIRVDPDNEKHLLLFRRMLELSMAQGLWAGMVGHD